MSQDLLLRMGFSQTLVEHLMSFQCPNLVYVRAVGAPLYQAEDSMITILQLLSTHPSWLTPLKGPWRRERPLGDVAWLAKMMEA